MKYCQKCILPDTRPNLIIDESGICNACQNHGKKDEIDWIQREKLFQIVLDNAKKNSKGYDCLIPVSGGKDSTWQVIKCLEYGLKPLCVTWKTPARTGLGRENLQSLIDLGVDHIDYQVSPEVEKKFMLAAYKKYGSTAIPMHMALFNIPLSLAVKFNIPLVIWGENSAEEYGGEDEETKGFQLNDAWLKKYGVTYGTTAKDWISNELTKKELTPYFGPSGKELEEAGVLAIFLGYYFEWDPEISLKAALETGFKVRAEGAKTGYYNYADIDDDFISLHHYLKWYKFGFTRTYDNLSLEIRNGRITRDEAIAWLKKRGDETPLGDIKKFCEFTNIKQDDFFAIAEEYRNKEIWTLENDAWKIKDFLIQDWKWL
jgi:N-acetyl sugar amidotransferase